MLRLLQIQSESLATICALIALTASNIGEEQGISSNWYTYELT